MAEYIELLLQKKAYKTVNDLGEQSIVELSNPIIVRVKVGVEQEQSGEPQQEVVEKESEGIVVKDEPPEARDKDSMTLVTEPEGVELIQEEKVPVHEGQVSKEEMERITRKKVIEDKIPKGLKRA